MRTWDVDVYYQATRTVRVHADTPEEAARLAEERVARMRDVEPSSAQATLDDVHEVRS